MYRKGTPKRPVNADARASALYCNRRRMNDKTMKHRIKEPEYDFSGGMRSKYYKRYMENRNVVVLEPDVHKNAKAVNEALRSLMQGRRTRRDLTKRSTRSRAKAARG
jgi:hypothetical protein